jgi:hypothetical protein
MSSYCQGRAHTFKSTDWEYSYEGNSSDTLGAGDSILYKEVKLPQHGDALKYKIYLDVDSIGGTSDAANKYNFFLQAKNSDDETYSNLDTIGYIGTSDTTFSFVQTTTSEYYKYWRMYIEGLTDELVIELQLINWSFYK